MSVQLSSLRSIVGGGIEFATPDDLNSGVLAKDGTEFELHESASQEWLNWSPHIRWRPTDITSDDAGGVNAGRSGLQSTMRVK